MIGLYIYALQLSAALQMHRPIQGLPKVEHAALCSRRLTKLIFLHLLVRVDF